MSRGKAKNTQFERGAGVKILSGAFAGYSGLITTTYPEQKRYVVEIQLLKRAIFVEFSPQVLRLAKVDHAPPPSIPNKESTLSAVETFTQGIIRQLAAQPELMHTLSSRAFEQLIAEILADMGYQVRLTPESRDGGRDILAILNAPLGPVLTIVECKRFAPDRPVGIDIVERFLWVVERKDHASGGLIATTSHFSRPALDIANELEYRLLLRDFTAVSEWLARYGHWTAEGSAGIWLPSVR